MKALEGLDEKNGSSVVAIKNYIAENWPEKAESSQFSNSFKKALAALAEDSSIVRPKKQEGNPDGATGSYKINKEKSKEKEKEAKEKEKAAKEKEKEKEKAAKEKEKEKEKAAKGKEKEKAAKEKEKEKAAKEKEKDKAGKKASSSTKTESSGPPNNKEMIMKALEGLDEKNGSSVVAIKNYIAENWPEKAESSQFSNSFKKALAALAEDSSIVRPKKQEGNPDGATGSYKINKDKKSGDKKAAEKPKSDASKSDEAKKSTKASTKGDATKATAKGDGEKKAKGTGKTKEKAATDKSKK